MRNTSKSGSAASLRGLNYEAELAYLLNNPNNWKSSIPLLDQILTAENIERFQIIKVSATTDITSLKTGGASKTDLVLTLHLKNGRTRNICFSCKRSTKKMVSFHEYPAEAFIAVLQVVDIAIQNLLKKHETDGSARFFTPLEKQSLTKYFGLGLNRRVLTEWAILGRGHIGQVSQHQIADYVICNDQLRTIDDYIKKLNEKLKKRPDTGFGTGFSWTRQSRGTGKTIQLKGPVW